MKIEHTAQASLVEMLTQRCARLGSQLERQRLCELKNGRLAMIGLVGCLIGGNGAVPGMDAVALPGAAFTLPFGTYASYH